ncbi:MAG TPA: PQQ-binding-like beta-propeller repeat protein [Gaiellaceae bacterium]|nr:PQQ-binding-like beta-propeller repeat protein [Gaiellaceae bacterium]
MSRRAAAGLATILVVAVAAACAAIAQAVLDPALGPTSRLPEPVLPAKPTAPPPKPKPKQPKPTTVRVTVVDGDTHRRLRGARVVIGRRADYATRRGLAAVKIKRRTALEVRVSKAGYTTRSVRMPFRQKRAVTIRIYRTALQWTTFGAGPRRTNAHPEIELRPPFRLVWSRGIGSLIEFPAVVSDGVAFIGNFRGTIYAIEMRRGKVVWKYDPPGGKMASSPAVVGRHIVVHGMDGIVRVLDRRNGRLRWQYRIGSPIESSPVVVGGVDYFGAWNGRVYALDLRRRTLRWSFRTGHKITSSAALAKGTLYIGDYGGRLHALSARSGKRRWRAAVNGRIYGTPAVAKGRVFVPSSTGGSMTAFTTSGRYLWRVGTGAYVYSSPAVWGGRVYFGSYNGRLYAVSASSGRVLWTVRTNGPVSGAAVVVAGVAYAGSTRGSITGVDARSGAVLLRFPHGEYVPVSGNGRRLLLHGYSRLYAVEPKRKPKR